MTKKIVNGLLNTLLMLGIVGLFLFSEVLLNASKSSNADINVFSEMKPEEKNLIAFQSVDDYQVATLPQTITYTSPIVEKTTFSCSSSMISTIGTKNILRRFYGCYEFQNLKFIPVADSFIDFCNFRS
ncbi:MAG: hypothetical protein PHR53_04220 [Bacteroidales bacterium]|nr:hypothetical protein [Bacteroidales bacterium]